MAWGETKESNWHFQNSNFENSNFEILVFKPFDGQMFLKDEFKAPDVNLYYDKSQDTKSFYFPSENIVSSLQKQFFQVSRFFYVDVRSLNNFFGNLKDLKSELRN